MQKKRNEAVKAIEMQSNIKKLRQMSHREINRAHSLLSVHKNVKKLREPAHKNRCKMKSKSNCMLLKCIESHMKNTAKNFHHSKWWGKKKCSSKIMQYTCQAREEHATEYSMYRSFVLFVLFILLIVRCRFISARNEEKETEFANFRCDWLFLSCERMPNVFACLVFMFGFHVGFS